MISLVILSPSLVILSPSHVILICSLVIPSAARNLALFLSISEFRISIFLLAAVASFVAGAIYGRKFAARAEREAKALKAAAEERASFYKAHYESLTEQAKSR